MTPRDRRHFAAFGIAETYTDPKARPDPGVRLHMMPPRPPKRSLVAAAKAMGSKILEAAGLAAQGGRRG
jgi:hypothetical protein